jgi:hypothetical protein
MIVLNPSTAIQNGAAMVAALTCLEFIREIPAYASGAPLHVLIIKSLIAIIVVIGILIIMFTWEKEGGVSGVGAGVSSVSGMVRV